MFQAVITSCTQFSFAIIASPYHNKSRPHKPDRISWNFLAFPFVFFSDGFIYGNEGDPEKAGGSDAGE
jgi:hypothetical protein